MKDILEDLIRLNVALEGSLRVLLQRESPEALAAARQDLDRINALFTSLETPADNAGSQIQTEPAAAEAPVPAAADAAETATQAVAVDELVARHECRDLRQAFTLNDKFLFRRELFGGSDQELSDTIDLLTAMHSLDEAREYLLDDLQWNPDNDVVKDFLDIVTNHFKTRTT